ncbi:lipopolysaccharide biosynthesis protein [Paenibacillus lemnae]|uniref:Polysaccharide biosynthesis protein n=1 Tax=Paenibacillus lemnae TaxID=1330551 RepID=A0A848M8P9_PAELE|nr:hypothetical protein [Paenibacillus lemnae]NMO96639.1 hypothetical protein [Paenibacillus lemnae]
MIKKLFSVYASNMLLGILGFITVPVLLAHMGIEGYGYYGIYLTLFSYYTLFELGIIKHFTKLLSQNNNAELQKVISCFYYFTVAMIILSIPFIVPIIQAGFGVPWKYALLLGVMVPIEYVLYMPSKIHIAYAAANKKFERISAFNLVSGLIRYMLLIIGAVVTQHIFIVLLLLTLRRIFDIRLSRRMIREGHIRIFDLGQVNRDNLRQVFRYYKESFFLSVTQALQINLSGMMALMVSHWFGVAGLGLFRSTYDVLSKIWFFSNGLGMVVFPYFAGGSVKTANYRKYTLISWGFYSVLLLVFICLFPYVNQYMLHGLLQGRSDFLLYLFMLISVLLAAQSNLSYEYLQARGEYKSLWLITLVTNLVFGACAFVVYSYTHSLLSVGIAWTSGLILQTCWFEAKSLKPIKLAFWYPLAFAACWLLAGYVCLRLQF